MEKASDLRVDDIILFTMSPKRNRDKETLHLGKITALEEDAYLVQYRKKGTKKFTEPAIVPHNAFRRLIKACGFRPEQLLEKFGGGERSGRKGHKKATKTNQVAGMTFKY